MKSFNIQNITKLAEKYYNLSKRADFLVPTNEIESLKAEVAYEMNSCYDKYRAYIEEFSASPISELQFLLSFLKGAFHWFRLPIHDVGGNITWSGPNIDPSPIFLAKPIGLVSFLKYWTNKLDRFCEIHHTEKSAFGTVSRSELNRVTSDIEKFIKSLPETPESQDPSTWNLELAGPVHTYAMEIFQTLQRLAKESHQIYRPSKPSDYPSQYTVEDIYQKSKDAKKSLNQLNYSIKK